LKKKEKKDKQMKKKIYQANNRATNDQYNF